MTTAKVYIFIYPVIYVSFFKCVSRDIEVQIFFASPALTVENNGVHLYQK